MTALADARLRDVIDVTNAGPMGGPGNRVSKGDIARYVRTALFDTHRPLLAHLTVTRYCNLDCAYCNEFDKVSKPVPLADLHERVDRLAALGTRIVTLTGGEPLTHPDHHRVIRRIRDHGMIATTITNGFLLTQEKIEAMNDAGLQALQISIDGVEPDEITNKTLKSLARKLDLLERHAKFVININSVLGISEQRTQDAIAVKAAALAHGFSHTIGVCHEDDGTLAPLSETQRAVYAQLSEKPSIGHRLNYWAFQKNLMAGKPNDWRCRAGARYLYICENGLVHYCSQQRGHPGIPLADYGVAEIERAFAEPKGCAPFCTVSCVQQASLADRWRSQRGPAFDFDRAA